MKSLLKKMKNQKGFTLIESLLSLYILTFVTTLSIMILSSLFFHVNSQMIPSFELENFVIQTQNEFREANEWSVDKDTVRITSRYDEHITYSYYNNKIRRQVEGSGQEVLLQNVNTFTCEKLENGIKFIISDKNRKMYIRNIYRLGE